MKMVRLVMVLIFTCVCFSNSYAAGKQNFSTSPKTNNGKKWRVGYLQGGNGGDYLPVLKGVYKGFAELGWVKNKDIPNIDGEGGTTEMWQWMSKNSQSVHLEFVEDAFYNADWKSELRGKNKETLLNRLNTQKDIDIMIAMGTWAGQDLANNDHSVATIVLTASDPLKAKIIKSVEDSGYDHLHAHVDPDRYRRQVILFHEIIGFNKLGVVYEDTEYGRNIAQVNMIEEVAKEMNFEVVLCNAKYSDITKEQAADEVKKCHEELAPKVDAVYVTTHTGVYPKSMSNVLDPLNKKEIATFSQRGSSDVRYGVLMSISQANFVYAGQFYAEIMAKIFNGAKPRELGQIFEDPPKIAINLETAKIIGYNPPVDILGAADEIFNTIEKFE